MSDTSDKAVAFALERMKACVDYTGGTVNVAALATLCARIEESEQQVARDAVYEAALLRQIGEAKSHIEQQDAVVETACKQIWSVGQDESGMMLMVVAFAGIMAFVASVDRYERKTGRRFLP